MLTSLSPGICDIFICRLLKILADLSAGLGRSEEINFSPFQKSRREQEEAGFQATSLSSVQMQLQVPGMVVKASAASSLPHGSPTSHHLNAKNRLI